MAMTNQQNTDRQLQAVDSQAKGNIMEEVVAKGDLKALSPEQRASYYTNVCKSMGLNPFTKPFEYITLNNKLTLYATRTAADQLRKINAVSITNIEREIVDDLIIVTVRVADKTGRTDEEVGAVSFGALKGEAKANAIMKAITKAKRRATLSICGLGWMDETEVETIPTASPVTVDVETGEIHEPRQTREDRPTATIDVETAPKPTQGQQPLQSDADERERANKRAHAVATGLFGASGHDVLHVMASLVNCDSLKDCDTEQLNKMADRLEKQSPEELDTWFQKWIAPRMPVEDGGDVS